MSTERTAKSTGIYLHTPPEHASGADMKPAIRKWAAKHRAARRRFFDWLANGADVAKATVDDPTATKQDRVDARDIYGYLLAVNNSIDNGNTKEAVYQAFHLGVLYERIHVRPFEPLVVDGRTIRNARRKGGDVTKARSDKKSSEILRLLDEFKNGNQHLNSTAAADLLAEMARKEHKQGRVFRSALISPKTGKPYTSGTILRKAKQARNA